MSVQPFHPGPLEAQPDPIGGEGVWKVVVLNRPNICTAQMLSEADATLYAEAPDLHRLLISAEAFIAGFEGAEMQDGVDQLLSRIRASLARAVIL